MNDILTLREKRSNLIKQARTFLDSKRDKGYLNDEDATIFDNMEVEIIDIGNHIERLEKCQNMEREFSDNTRNPLVNAPYNAYAVGGEYSRAFWNAMRGRGVNNALSEGIDTSGGYLVPEEFSNELVQALNEQNIFRNIARIVPTSREKLKVPVAAADGAANWIDENAPIPETNMTFSQIVLNAYKLGGLIKASTELIEDAAFPLESYIADRFARLIGKAEEEAFCVGDGNNKPTGIFTTASGVQIGVTTASPTVITFDDIIDLFHSVKSPYRGNSVFVTNDGTIKELRKIKDGNGQYIWQPSVKDGMPDTIIGKSVYTTPYVPEIAAGATVMAFGDFSYYWIANRRETRFKVLYEKYAENDQVGFYATERVDGKLVLPEAIKLLKMGATGA